MASAQFRGYSIFELPLIDHLPGATPGWLMNPGAWEINKESITFFNNARDGQGFSVIVYIEINPETHKPIARIRLHPAFNGADGMARENKLGERYDELNYVDSEKKFGQSGAGMIHKLSVPSQLLKTALAEEKHPVSQKFLQLVKGEAEERGIQLERLSEAGKKNFYNMVLKKNLSDLMSWVRKKQNEFEGYTFGLSLIKGAESKNPNDYQIEMIQEEVRVKFLRDAYLKRESPRQLEAYEKNKKYLVLLKSKINPYVYEVLYIANQKFVRTPQYSNKPKLATIVLENADVPKEVIVSLALKALNLQHLVTVSNKSASQNNSSVSYDFDFESYAMYLDVEKYLLREGLLTPEGVERGSLYDVQRSVPPGLMVPFCQVLLPALGEMAVNEAITAQNKRWSSWDNVSYQAVLDQFNSLSNDEFLKMIGNNIHIVVRLLERTIEIGIKSSQFADNNPDFENIQDHPSFPGMFSFMNTLGKCGFNSYIINNYLTVLRERLHHLLMSFLAKKGDQTALLTKEDFIPEWIRNPISPHEKSDRRTIDQILLELQQLVESYKLIDSFVYTVNCGSQVAEIISNLHNLLDVRKFYSEKAAAYAKAMCVAKFKHEVTDQFVPLRNHLLYYLRYACGQQDAVPDKLKELLQVADEKSGQTALENAVQKGWYDVAYLLVSHGANMMGINQVTKKNVFDVFLEKNSTASRDEADQIDRALVNILQVIRVNTQQAGDLLRLVNQFRADLPTTLKLLNHLRERKTDELDQVHKLFHHQKPKLQQARHSAKFNLPKFRM